LARQHRRQRSVGDALPGRGEKERGRCAAIQGSETPCSDSAFRNDTQDAASCLCILTRAFLGVAISVRLRRYPLAARPTPQKWRPSCRARGSCPYRN